MADPIQVSSFSVSAGSKEDFGVVLDPICPFVFSELQPLLFEARQEGINVSWFHRNQSSPTMNPPAARRRSKDWGGMSSISMDSVTTLGVISSASDTGTPEFFAVIS